MSLLDITDKPLKKFQTCHRRDGNNPGPDVVLNTAANERIMSMARLFAVPR
jgi:hypothetical protein